MKPFTTALVVAIILILIPIGFYLSTFGGYNLSSNSEDWAQFGDFLVEH